MVGPQQIYFGGDVLVFICQEHSVFSLLSFTECSSFFATAFVFHFRLDLRSDILISLYQGVFLPLIFIGFHQNRCLKKISNGVGKEKKIYAK
jgi:hypothetical protein